MLALGYVTIVIVCGLTAPSKAAERGSSCITPNSETGTCIPVNSCTVIKEAIQTRNRVAAKFAVQSQCGLDSVPLVCCGSTGYPQTQTLTQTTTSNTPTRVISLNHKFLPSTSECGFHKFDQKIVGGQLTDIYEFPWLALLRFSDQNGEDADFRCGGTLINNRYVVTAAHCVDVNRGESTVTSVRLGEWQISTQEDCQPDGECADATVDVGIERIIPHMLYKRRTHENDIALIRLKRNVAYTEFIRPICIPHPNTPLPRPQSDLYVSGWGATENSSLSDMKLKVKVPLIPQSTCSSKLSQRGAITDFQVCAGGVSGKDSCGGDSGGPLMRYETTPSESYQYFLEGVISWGVGCGNEGFPGVYTRVAKYADWITSNMVGF